MVVRINLNSHNKEEVSMEFNESGLPSTIWKVVNERGLVWESIWSTFLFKSFLAGTAKYLASVKGEDPQVAVLKDGDKVVFGALVEKQENSDANGYTLSFFFGDKKMPENAKVATTDDSVYSAHIRTECLERFHMFFRPVDGNDYVTKVLDIIIHCIVDFFRMNLTVDPHISLEMKDFFKIDGVFVDEKVELSFTPEETLKQIIKDDARNAVSETEETADVAAA